MVIFFLMRIVPGDIVELKYVGQGAMISQETLQKERQLLGLDRPLWVQFGSWIWGLMRGISYLDVDGPTHCT